MTPDRNRAAAPPASTCELTTKQAAFVREYLVDKNATQAAIRAGYSAKTARSQGERLLTNADIRRAVDAGVADLASRVGLTAERVLRERMRIAFFDPRQLLDSEGNPKPLHELDEATAAAVAGLDVVQMTGGNETPGVISFVKKYKLAAKDTSLAALEKYLGLNEKPVRFDVPKIAEAGDCSLAQAAVLEGLASGRLGLAEAKVLADLVEGQRRAFETHALMQRMEAMEKALDAALNQRGRPS
jgi:phage terminase small subunit